LNILKPNEKVGLEGRCLERSCWCNKTIKWTKRIFG